MVATMRNFILSIFVLSFAPGSYTYAATYKWVDEQGNVIYSQQPPPDQAKDYQRIQGLPSSRSSASSSNQSSAGSSTGDSASDSGSAGGGASSEAAAKAKETRDKNCAAAKKNLELYTTYRRFPDKDGTMVRMDDNERQQKIQESEQQIQDFCDE